MRTLSLGPLLLVALAAGSSALAADLKPVPKAPPPPLVLERWTGAYFGVHFGYGHGRTERQVVDAPGVFIPDSFDMKGGFGGVQLGVNRQLGQWVFGGELSLSRSFVNAKKSPCLIGVTFQGVPTAAENCKSELDWLALATGRLGFAQDNWMVYAIGGWAIAGFTDRSSPPSIVIGAPAFTASTDMRSGPAFGAGVEVSLTANISAGLEYLHVSFENGRADFTNITTNRELDLVRGRLNFKPDRTAPQRSTGWLKAPPSSPAEIWTGAYFGLHGGYAWGRTGVDLSVNGLFDVHDSYRNDGGFIGAQLGIMRQVGGLVLGAELSLSDVRARGSKQDCFSDLGPGTLCQSQVDWLLLGLARVGIAHGNLMPYATGGVAVAGVSYLGNESTLTLRTPAIATTVPGVAYGGGVEVNLGNGVVAGVEYLHVDLDGKPLIPALGLFTGTDHDIDLVRARLSVRPDQCCGGALSAFASSAGAPPGHAVWNGVYVGAYGGYGWGRERHLDTRFLNGSVPPPVAYAYDLNGGLAGVQLGLNVQRGNLVFGGEVSLGGGAISGSLTDCVVRGAGGSQRTTCTSKVEALLTAMGRAGFAKDSWLVYATGGWAIANTYFEGVRTDLAGLGFPPFAADNTYANGPAYGGGVEVALGHGFSAGVEYLHASLRVTSQPFSGLGIGDRDLGLNLLRGRVNMKLN